MLRAFYTRASNFETSSHAQTILQMTVGGHTLACVEDVYVCDSKCNIKM